MNFPDDLRYTREHEWIRIDGDVARVGITDFAQDALGDVVYVQLPEVGTEVTALQACCEVESTKSVSDVYSPLTGTIDAVNTDLSDAPQRINEDPYGGGWIFSIQLGSPGELDELLDAAAYRTFVESQ
jgi:glycine cleavage system H protein